jgi:cell division protein DivIC
MSNKDRSAKKRKVLRWRNLLVLFLVFFFCFRLGTQVKQYFELEQEAEYYRAQLAVAEEEYQQQLEKQELLYNESYLERMARERLGMVKEGESVVSIMKIESTDTANHDIE